METLGNTTLPNMNALFLLLTLLREIYLCDAVCSYYAHDFPAPLYLCFIDLVKACGSVNRDVLLSVLDQRQGSSAGVPVHAF